MSHKHKNPFNNDAEPEMCNIEHPEACEENKSEEEEKQPENNEFQEKYNTLNNQYIRLAADFDNYRKRQEQERENLVQYSKEQVVSKMLEILDNFERGEKALEKIEDCQQVKDSYNQVYKKMVECFKKVGLEEIESEGKEFDPNFHEAVMKTPTGEYPENTIINVMQKGYKLGDKVLRPALVNVATAE